MKAIEKKKSKGGLSPWQARALEALPGWQEFVAEPSVTARYTIGGSGSDADEWHEKTVDCDSIEQAKVMAGDKTVNGIAWVHVWNGDKQTVYVTYDSGETWELDEELCD